MENVGGVGIDMVTAEGEESDIVHGLGVGAEAAVTGRNIERPRQIHHKDARVFLLLDRDNRGVGYRFKD